MILARRQFLTVLLASCLAFLAWFKLASAARTLM